MNSVLKHLPELEEYPCSFIAETHVKTNDKIGQINPHPPSHIRMPVFQAEFFDGGPYTADIREQDTSQPFEKPETVLQRSQGHGIVQKAVHFITPACPAVSDLAQLLVGSTPVEMLGPETVG